MYTASAICSLLHMLYIRGNLHRPEVLMRVACYIEGPGGGEQQNELCRVFYTICTQRTTHYSTSGTIGKDNLGIGCYLPPLLYCRRWDRQREKVGERVQKASNFRSEPVGAPSLCTHTALTCQCSSGARHGQAPTLHACSPLYSTACR